MTKYNELQISASKTRKRVGRGIAAGGGKTAGRGTKGQNSRTGKKLRVMFQGGQRPLAQAVPKARGFKSLRTPAQVVYMDHLEAFAGKTIDNMSLYKNGLIGSPFQAVKVIQRGELTAKVTLKVSGASKAVVEAITKAGGSFEKTAVPIKKSQKEAESTDKK
jgi:large subunit ribosomal protein L15